MPMNGKYPFQMVWRRYEAQELIKEAEGNLSSYDREDLVELVLELADRLKGRLNERYNTVRG